MVKKSHEPVRRTIGAVGKVADILAAVCAQPQGLSLTELAKGLALDPGLVHRYLNSLTAARLLHRDHRTRLVSPGPALLAARQVAAGHVTRQSAEFVGALNQLHGQLRETLSVLRWTGSGPQAAWVKDSPDTLALTYRLGAVLPLLSTASGQICLAFAPTDEVRPLLEREWPRRRAELGPQFNRWSLQDLLADVRRRRLARGRNYLHRVSAISAPLFDMEHRFWGVLTALGPSSRFGYGWRGEVARGLHAFSLAHAVPEHFVDSLQAMYA
jgi:DNA-binding IclR family transcriptional regulator